VQWLQRLVADRAVLEMPIEKRLLAGEAVTLLDCCGMTGATWEMRAWRLTFSFYWYLEVLCLGVFCSLLTIFDGDFCWSVMTSSFCSMTTLKYSSTFCWSLVFCLFTFTLTTFCALRYWKLFPSLPVVFSAVYSVEAGRVIHICILLPLLCTWRLSRAGDMEVWCCSEWWSVGNAGAVGGAVCLDATLGYCVTCLVTHYSPHCFVAGLTFTFCIQCLCVYCFGIPILGGITFDLLGCRYGGVPIHHTNCHSGGGIVLPSCWYDIDTVRWVQCHYSLFWYVWPDGVLEVVHLLICRRRDYYMKRLQLFVDDIHSSDEWHVHLFCCCTTLSDASTYISSILYIDCSESDILLILLPIFLPLFIGILLFRYLPVIYPHCSWKVICMSCCSSIPSDHSVDIWCHIDVGSIVCWYSR